jgi:osmotically-inducible protein OsmY
MRRGPHRGKGPKGFMRSDDRVRELVCEALTDDEEVDASNIEVTVKGGEVTLAGSVEDREMKRRAEDCVERVGGVRDVHNQLHIRA